MNKINFSKTDNNIFISCLDQNIKENNLSLPAADQERIYPGRGAVETVAYSYNGQHVIYVNENKSKINIISYNSLINSQFDYVFTFQSDFTILNYALSPNNNHIAILFRAENSVNLSYYGPRNIDPVNRMRFGVHVYDFTPGNVNIIYERFEEDIRFIHLSDDNKIALSGGFNVRGQDSGLIIVDLRTRDIITHGLDVDNVELIYFYPNTHPSRNTNRILVINSTDNDNIKNIEMRSSNNLRLIEARHINLFIFDLHVKSDGGITLATDQGLFQFTMDLYDRNFIPLFPEYFVSQITYSLREDKIGLTTLGWHPHERNRSIPDNIFIYELGPRNQTIFQSNPHPGQYRWSNAVQEAPFLRMMLYQHEQPQPMAAIPNPEPPRAAIPNPPQAVVSSEPEIQDAQLDIVVATQPTNATKLRKYEKKECFDIFNMSEEIIGHYLSSDPDNLVIFYKYPSDADFQASCLTFSALKTYLKDPNYVFYRCIDRKDFRTYHRDLPEFLKIPTQAGNLFVDYQLMKQKYMQRQNMIFLEHSEQIPKTITMNASLTMHFVSRNHCQDGSVIELYRIIF